MSIFLPELKKMFRPLRLFALLCIWCAVAGIGVSFTISDLDFRLTADTSALVAEKYGTHLDAQERNRIEEELLSELLADINSRIEQHEAFRNAQVHNYEEYTYLRYGKPILSNISDEQFEAMTDEDMLREFGITKEQADRTWTDAQIALIDLNCPDAKAAAEILWQCDIYRQIEDWISFWYDDRDRLSTFTENNAFDFQNDFFAQFCNTDAYTGNMSSQVSERVGYCFRFIAVAVLCSVFVLCAVEPANDRITKVDRLQAVARDGKKVLYQQRNTALAVACGMSVFGIVLSLIYLKVFIPSVLWTCPLNSYQSFFSIYYFSGTLEQYFWLLALLLVLLSVGSALIGFSISVFSKSYTGLLGALLPCGLALQWLANFLYKVPFSYRQSISNVTYLSDICPLPFAEIPICLFVAVIGATASVFAVKKRERERRNM